MFLRQHKIEFIELITSHAAQIKFKYDFSSMPVTKFWINRLQSYPVLLDRVAPAFLSISSNKIEFIELITSHAAQIKFKYDFSSMPVTKFWTNHLQSYPVLP